MCGHVSRGGDIDPITQTSTHLTSRLDAVVDDRGDQFLAAADGSSEGTVGPPAGIVFPSPAESRRSRT
jgi:hypothetical protein